MSQNAEEPQYKIEKDGEGRVSTIRFSADDRQLPIDPDDREYCKFLTWAATQSPPIAATFERLEKGSVYLGQEADVVAYCKEHGVVLLCGVYTGGGKHQLASPTSVEHSVPVSVNHDPLKTTNSAGAPGRFLFYRLYKAADGQYTESGGAADCERLQVFVSHSLDVRLNALLADENSEIRALSTWPVEKTFVYVDVSDFSTHPVGRQQLIINSLIQITTNDKLWRVAWKRLYRLARIKRPISA
jgi:hypothetical protein